MLSILFWALFAFCSSLFYSYVCFSPFFALLFLTLSLSLLASVHHRTPLNFLCAPLQLRFTRSRATVIDLVSHYPYATTYQSLTHMRSFASFRSTLLRFTLSHISPLPIYLSLCHPLSIHLGPVDFILLCFYPSFLREMLFVPSFLRVPFCFTLLRCVSCHSLSLFASVPTSPCSSALLCLA